MPFVLKGYPNNKLDILGMCRVHVTVGDVTKQLRVCINSGPKDQGPGDRGPLSELRNRDIMIF